MSLNDGRVVSNFITQALDDLDITLYGDGVQTRSFCYVDDLIDGLIKLMDSPKEFTGPCNLGNPEELSIEQLAKKIIQLSGSSSKIVYRPLPQDDPMQRRPDIGLAMKELGWSPCICLNEGIKKTIRYFKEIKQKSHEERSDYEIYGGSQK